LSNRSRRLRRWLAESTPESRGSFMHILHILGCLVRRGLKEVRIKNQTLQMLCQFRWTPKNEAHAGVSKAKQAIMFGQWGALMSGRVWLNAL
jgi:hypothetical protein